MKAKQRNEILRVMRKGIWAYRKERAAKVCKSVMLILWTVTIFPFILLWMFITDEI